MSVVKLNTGAPAGTPNTGSEGGSGLGMLAGIALLGLAIWGAVTYFGKKEEPKTEQEPETETAE
ncbi:MAG: LPXTG cell wall anchor domain-containing protein [Bacteroidota bacterium]